MATKFSIEKKPEQVSRDHFELGIDACRQALDCAALGLWDHNFQTGRVRRCDRWAQMLGYDPGEIDDQLVGWTGLIHPDDRSRVYDLIAAHERGETDTFSVVHRMRAKDGSWRWINNWGRIIERDENGRPLRALGFHRDITEQKEVELALAESESKYRSVVEQLAECIALLDADTLQILEANRSLQEMLGYATDDLLNLTFHELTGQSHEQIDRLVSRALAEGSGFRFEQTFRCRDGAAVPVETSISCVEVGARSVLCVVCHDVSSHKQSERQMQLIRDELELRVQQRTAELEEVNAQLQRDQEALNQKNMALKEILRELESGRSALSRQIRANIDRIAGPLLSQLETDGNPRTRLSANLLRQTLDDVVSPFVDTVDSTFRNLSPREVQICEMVRNGMQTKEIAVVLGTSPETVRKQRAIARRKLGLTHSNANLSSFLRRFDSRD